MRDDEWDELTDDERAQLLRAMTSPEEKAIKLLFIQGLIALERYLQQRG